MEFNTISVERDVRGVVTLTLNRPDKHNAMNDQLIDEVTAAIGMINEDGANRVLVLTGAGDSFCAGGDLKWMEAQFEATREQRIAGSTRLAAMLRRLNESAVPVIGRINGQAYGGGTGMMAVCDIAIAAASARFQLTEARLGLTPATISPFVVAKMGQANARRCFLNSLPMNADKARNLGLVDEVAADTELDEAVDREVSRFLECGPGAVSATKRLIRYVASHDMDANADYTATLLADTWETEEAQTGIRCFFAKETPPWRQQ
jgi:methylglutaconyl-CoA hydratase